MHELRIFNSGRDIVLFGRLGEHESRFKGDVIKKGAKMREKIQKIKKNIFRIAIFSIGGVIAIFGLMFEIFTLVKMPGDAFTIMPYFVLAILIMSVGLYLCFLIIKPAHYFPKLHKMSNEEKVIEHIKKCTRHSRKSEILAVTIFFIVGIFQHYKNVKSFDTELSEKLNAMSSFEDSNVELPTLLSRFYKLASMRIELNIDFCKFVAFMLVLMFFIFPRNIISGDNKYSP